MWRFLRICPAIAILLSMAGAANALVLDWTTATWNPQPVAPNLLRSNYDVDGTAGTDLSITLGYSTQNAGAPYRAGLPAVDTAYQGGQAAGTRSLHLGVDFTAQSHFVTITIDFSGYAQGVEGVSFSLFDIDRADGSALYIDQIRSIHAIGVDGVTQIAPTITHGSAVTLSRTTLNDPLTQMLTGNGPSADTGAGSDAGNATISFGSTAIRSLTFTWGVPNNNANNPIPMDIAFGNINFSPVPEINPAWSAAFSCFAALGVVLGHRRSVRKRAKDHKRHD